MTSLSSSMPSIAPACSRETNVLASVASLVAREHVSHFHANLRHGETLIGETRRNVAAYLRDMMVLYDFARSGNRRFVIPERVGFSFPAKFQAFRIESGIRKRRNR
jgi:hypothetical protein